MRTSLVMSIVIILASLMLLQLSPVFGARHEVEVSTTDSDQSLGFESNYWPTLASANPAMPSATQAALRALFSESDGRWCLNGSPGATMNIAFNGTGVAVLYGEFIGGATFSYNLDNGAVAGVVATDASPTAQQTLVIAATGTLSPGAHVLQVKNVGGAFVVLDAIDVYEEVPLNYAEDNDPSLVTVQTVQGTGGPGTDTGFDWGHGGTTSFIVGGAEPIRIEWSTYFTGTDIGILDYNGWLYTSNAGLEYDIDGGSIAGFVDQGPTTSQVGHRRPTLLATGLSDTMHHIALVSSATPNTITTFDAFFSSGTFSAAPPPTPTNTPGPVTGLGQWFDYR